ncbi:MAG TPA: type II secretion system protein [Terrimesophilobacter sp.]|nr:type II secretion system protein [Terrimesophilobacter sp.]
MNREGTGIDEGFGLVEIVVSMLILGLLAISFLPLLIQGLLVAQQNRTLATATQLIHDQIEQARAIGTCDALAAFGASVSQPNANFELTRTVEHFEDDSLDPCAITYPGVVKLSLAVTEDGEAKVLVEATTLVLVNSEN